MNFRKIKKFRQTNGFDLSVVRIFRYLTRPFFEYQRHYLYENKLDVADDLLPKIDKFSLKIISTTNEVDDLIADGFNIQSYYLGLGKLNERISKGAILFSLFVDGELAHTSWIALNKVAEEIFDHPHLTIDYNQEAFISDSRTNPKYQRLYLYSYVYSKMFSYLKENGKSTARFAIKKNNVPPQKAQLKFRSIIYGESRYLRLVRRIFYKEIFYK